MYMYYMHFWRNDVGVILEIYNTLLRCSSFKNETHSAVHFATLKQVQLDTICSAAIVYHYSNCCTKTRRYVTNHPHWFLVGWHAGTKRVDKIIKVTAVRVGVNLQEIAWNCGVCTCQIIFSDVLHLVVDDVQQKNTARYTSKKHLVHKARWKG